MNEDWYGINCEEESWCIDDQRLVWLKTTDLNECGLSQNTMSIWFSWFHDIGFVLYYLFISRITHITIERLLYDQTVKWSSCIFIYRYFSSIITYYSWSWSILIMDNFLDHDPESECDDRIQLSQWVYRVKTSFEIHFSLKLTIYKIYYINTITIEYLPSFIFISVYSTIDITVDL